MIKGLMLINDLVEDVEALATKALLTRSGLLVDSFTLGTSKTIKTAYNTKVIVNYLVDEITLGDYDFLVLPGGSHVFNNLGNYKLHHIINYFNHNNKLLAAICAAPLFLNELGLLKEKEYTAFPSVVNDIDGIYIKDQKVVKSNNIITSRSAATVYEFSFKIIETLQSAENLRKLQEMIVLNLS